MSNGFCFAPRWFRGRASVIYASVICAACALVGIGACRDTRAREGDTVVSPSPCGAEARAVVQRLGERTRRVSLLAPDSVVGREIADAYAPLVTPALLRSWQTTPGSAPGREVSSPWPARIEIRSMHADGAVCHVEGDLVFVTNADTNTVVERRPVSVEVTRDGWRVTAYEPERSADGATAADVVRRYYAAIDAHDYDSAYALWEGGGTASHQSRDQFASGFANTVQAHVAIGDSVRIGAAAGSQYATVPVVVDATLRDGRRQQFEGTYIIRRSEVDGATAEQRRWHIYAAHLRPR